MKTLFKAGCMLAMSIALLTSCSKEGWAPIDLIGDPHLVIGDSAHHFKGPQASPAPYNEQQAQFVLQNPLKSDHSTAIAQKK